MRLVLVGISPMISVGGGLEAVRRLLAFVVATRLFLLRHIKSKKPRLDIDKTSGKFQSLKMNIRNFASVTAAAICCFTFLTVCPGSTASASGSGDEALQYANAFYTDMEYNYRLCLL